MTFLSRRILIILPLVLALVYIFSMCPTIYLIDSGELATASYVLGIAHPTGYPLYTLISYFFAHLPGEPIQNLNLLSAVFTVCAAIFLFMTARNIIKNLVIPILIVSLFAFAPIVWRISVTNEVYPLTALFAILIFYSLFHMRDERGFYITCYLIGLSFTNHIIIFSVALPALCYSIIVYRPHFKTIVLGIIVMLLGVSLYAYLVARTLGGAHFAWGNTHNLQRLFWHITGKQYRVWMFTLSASEIIRNISITTALFFRNLLYVFIIPALIGFYYLARGEPRKFWLLLSMLILNVLYAINYSIPDIESYYIPGFIVLVVTSIYGFKLLQKYLHPFIVVPVAVLIPLINYSASTLRGNTFGNDYSRAHFEQLPQGSLVLCNYWDIYSPTLYMREVRRERTDLIIIDKELLRRTWYTTYLEHTYPQFYDDVRDAVSKFLVELYKFEYGKPYDPYTIQSTFIAMLEAFVDAKIATGVYFANPFDDIDLNQVKPMYPRIPRGLVFQVVRDTTDVMPFNFSQLNLRRPHVLNDIRLEYNIKMVQNVVQANYAYLRSVRKFAAAEDVRIWLTHF